MMILSKSNLCVSQRPPRLCVYRAEKLLVNICPFSESLVTFVVKNFGHVCKSLKLLI